jgi:hypothetical protein
VKLKKQANGSYNGQNEMNFQTLAGALEIDDSVTNETVAFLDSTTPIQAVETIQKKLRFSNEAITHFIEAERESSIVVNFS